MNLNDIDDLPLTDLELLNWKVKWLNTARDKQITPEGSWWTTWVVCAGRGFGKTLLGAQDLGQYACENAEVRCAVIAPTLNDVRAVCIEGESGLLSVIPPALIQSYNKSLLEIYLINGSIIRGFGSDAFDRLRGPQHHRAWCFVAGTLISMADGLLKPIENVVIGDNVMTRHGVRTVIDSGVSGNPNELVHIDCGVTNLTGTVDHPILVGNSWIPMGELKVGDQLCVSIKDICTLAGSMPTGLYMNNTTGQSLMATSSITKMKTRATTTLATLKRCLDRIIKNYIGLAARTPFCSAKLRLKRLMNCASQKTQNVFNALESLFLFHLAPQVSFALSHALKSGDATGLRPKQGSAKSVTATTAQQNDSSCIAQRNATPNQKSERIELRQLAVRHAERLPNTVTYNLTVEGEHEFIANGVVVHNCDELAAWAYPEDTWSMMKFGLRLGENPQVIVTTTPKPIDLVRSFFDQAADEDSSVILTTGSTYENSANLAKSFIDEMSQLDGTKLGRQELFAELLSELEGGIVNESWFKLWAHDRPLPVFQYIVQSYDCATSDKTTNDPTACVVLGVFKPHDDKPMSVMVIDCWSEHMQYPDLRPKVIEEATVVYGDENEFGQGKKVDLMLIEDKSAGIVLIQDLQRAGLPVRSYNPGKADKTMRLNLVAPLIMRGRVYLPESEERKGKPRKWLQPFVTQVCSFPNARHDDYVDALSQGLRVLRDMGFIGIDPAPDSDYDDDDRPRRQNPYAM
jgi:predicted phage terminase large subunit-like protein